MRWAISDRENTSYFLALKRKNKIHSWKIYRKLWYFLTSYFDQWHLHDIMLFFMYCLLTQAIMEPKHDPAHLTKALFDRVFYYSPSFFSERTFYNNKKNSCGVANISPTTPTIRHDQHPVGFLIQVTLFQLFCIWVIDSSNFYLLKGDIYTNVLEGKE
jgi:hypothetical protein